MLARGRPAAAVPHCRAGQPPKRRRQTRTAWTPATRTPQAAEARGPLWRGRFGPGRSARSSRSSRRVTVTTPWVHVSLPLRTGCSDDAHLARRATRIRLAQVSAASTRRDRARRVATCSVRPVVRPRPDALERACGSDSSHHQPDAPGSFTHDRDASDLGSVDGCRPVSSSAACSLLRSLVRDQLTAGQAARGPLPRSCWRSDRDGRNGVAPPGPLKRAVAFMAKRLDASAARVTARSQFACCGLEASVIHGAVIAAAVQCDVEE